MENILIRERKKLNLYLILCAIFLSNAIVAEMVGVKMFSLEKFLGIDQFKIPFINGTALNLNMSVGILIWPIVLIVSDLINEYFGKSGVKRISYLAAILIGYSFMIILGGTKLPPADFWLEVNNKDLLGNTFDINYAYSVIFRQGLGIIIGSITAFLVGQIIDAYTFHWIRKITGHKRLWIRVTGSNAVSQLIDSFLILFIAFYWLGNWSFEQVLMVGVIQYIYKITFAIILTPVIYVCHIIIDRYLGKEQSTEMMDVSSKEK